MKKAEIPYVFPFALFIALSLLGQQFENGTYIIYPIKTIAVAASLWYFRKSYIELKQDFSTLSAAFAIITGLIVFAIWILPEGLYPTLGDSEFNPHGFKEGALAIPLIVFRLIGAVLLVPVFEELFWRSFVIRWIINPEFRQVPFGKFTWASFGLTVFFFGLEHHRWLVGLFAGAIYNGLLYKEKNLWPCILAHSVTNLALGIYILYSRQWGFW